MGRTRRGTGFWSFVCYGVLMIWLLYGQRLGRNGDTSYFEQIRMSYNLIPFKTIGNYSYVAMRTTNTALLRHIIINLLGNVVMFVPLGYFLPMNCKCLRSFPKLIGWTIVIIAAIELIQLFTLLGSLDVDDLILNVAGAAIGYWLWRWCRR